MRQCVLLQTGCCFYRLGRRFFFFNGIGKLVLLLQRLYLGLIVLNKGFGVHRFALLLVVLHDLAQLFPALGMLWLFLLVHRDHKLAVFRNTCFHPLSLTLLFSHLQQYTASAAPWQGAYNSAAPATRRRSGTKPSPAAFTLRATLRYRAGLVSAAVIKSPKRSQLTKRQPGARISTVR